MYLGNLMQYKPVQSIALFPSNILQDLVNLLQTLISRLPLILCRLFLPEFYVLEQPFGLQVPIELRLLTRYRTWVSVASTYV